MRPASNSRVPIYKEDLNHMDFEPHLFFSGNCEEALNFYKKIFGGKIVSIMRWKDAPGDMGMPEDQ